MPTYSWPIAHVALLSVGQSSGRSCASRSRKRLAATVRRSLMKGVLAGHPPTRPRGYAPGVESRKEAREFLVSRRAKISPEQANLPAGTNRRVPGLRRSEVAALAGVSIEHYSMLER